jgi:hypothetical protein
MTFGLLSALVVCLAPVAASRADVVQPTHVVFVLADDLGPGDVGCSGGALAATPNLDRMARDGIRFTRFYTAAPNSRHTCRFLSESRSTRTRKRADGAHKMAGRRGRRARNQASTPGGGAPNPWFLVPLRFVLESTGPARLAVSPFAAPFARRWVGSK